MKKLAVYCCALLLFTQGFCDSISYTIPFESLANLPPDLLVGREAPSINAKAALNGEIIDFSTRQSYGKYIVLVFYPLDFTFVCPTELHAFQERLAEFESRGAQVVACSVDSVYSHLAWLNTPRTLGGIQGVQFPLISDLDKSIAEDYNILDENEGIAFRGLFLIDREGIIRHQVVNDLPLGRSVDETLRVLDALITYEQQGEVCPANWKPGDKTLKPTAEGLVEYFSEGQ